MALVREYKHTDQLLFEDKELLNFVNEHSAISIRELALGTIHIDCIENPRLPPIEERWISDEIGIGVFALEDIPADTYIGEYTGIVRRSSVLHPPNDYSFKYPVKDSIGRFLEINAEPWGNFTRHLNHSYKPNLAAENAYCGDVYHAIFLTNRPIAKGEQLTYNYGKNYWSLRGDPEEFTPKA